MWDPQVAEWGKHYRLVRYDRRGHGKSGAPTGPYTMEQLGRDVLSILDALKIEKTNWCGLSMGGMVGQWLGAFAPDRVEKLILSNTSAYYADKQPWNDRMAFARDKGLAALAGPNMERWFTPEFRQRAPQEVERMTKIFVATPMEGYLGCCAAVRDMDFRHTNPRITTPTLVIVGAKDPATTPAVGEALHKEIKGSQIASIEGAHIANLEQPEAYARTVLDVLRS
jgi:3-oxoadipate enol-lactonase